MFASRIEGLLSVLSPARDIWGGRVETPAPPAWCERRGWTDFLLGLAPHELAAAEEQGLLANAALRQRMPAALAEWLGTVASAARVPRLRVREHAPEAWRAVRERKRAQLAAMLDALAPLAADASRIVDFGSGRGHFARLAAGVFEREVLGLERDARFVERARRGAAQAGVERASFRELDPVARGFRLEAGELAFGLHACGELGDKLVSAAAEARCGLVLVSCCAQKISGMRRLPLSRAMAGLELDKELLGLSNLSSRAVGVETSLRATLRARECRHALTLLLNERGVAAPAGRELTGINRRQARAGLAAIAARAFAQRGLAPPSDAELARAERRAAEEYGRMRRLSLPRNALARPLELAIVLDRAQALSEAGLCVRVAEVFSPEVTPRNLGIFASRAPDRLPELEAAH